jgi:tungstate transport system substrate-binding protein
MAKPCNVMIREFSGLRLFSLACCIALLLGSAVACQSQLPFVDHEDGVNTLRIATTTSLDDSGLLDALIPELETEHNVAVELIAVGTGQAIVLGERGDVDLILVHAPELETEFVEQGYGVDRTTFMTNPFILIGPHDDPANISESASADDALIRIADSESTFVSRGDDSGTHFKELSIWEVAGFEPDSGMGWYHAAGQGMGETLLTANELLAYTLTDRATFTTIDPARVSDLVHLFGESGLSDTGDQLLDNPYSAIAVNPELHDHVQRELAAVFIEWLASERSREIISTYGQDEFGEFLFTVLD